MSGTTPNLGLPYPGPADPPDGATQIRALAEAADAAIPNATVGLSFSGGWNPGSGLWRPIAMDTTSFDHGAGALSIASGGIRIEHDAIVLLTGQVVWSGSTAISSRLAIGTDAQQSSPWAAVSDNTGLIAAGVLTRRFNAGDIARLHIYARGTVPTIASAIVTALVVRPVP